MVGPHRPLDDLLVRSAILKKVRHDAAPISGEHARYDAEIGPGGAAGAAAMEQKRGCSLAHFDAVELTAGYGQLPPLARWGRAPVAQASSLTWWGRCGCATTGDQ